MPINHVTKYDFPHVQPLRNGRPMGSVHAEDNPGETFCSWVFLSDQTHDGHRISLAAEVDKPLDCGRCVARMRTLIRQSIQMVKAPEVEEILGKLHA